MRMQDKLKELNVELPLLCSCHGSALDADPERCANNCIFYKNPKGESFEQSALDQSFPPVWVKPM